jgi:hypothetical protein
MATQQKKAPENVSEFKKILESNKRRGAELFVRR